MATSLRHDSYPHYAIVGGGAFGASTALALKRRIPLSRVTLFKGTQSHTASTDINKIIRSAYPVEDYVPLANKAMQHWKSDPLYRPYFHKTAWIQVRGDGNNQNVHRGQDDKMISLEQHLRLTSSLQSPRISEEEELWLNEDIGCVDSALALDAVIKEAINLGVEVKSQNALDLIIESDGTCRGVRSVDGHIIADETIVAAGVWTPTLLKNSKVKLFQDEVNQKNFFNATAVGVATLLLTNDEFDRLQNTPIIVTNKGEVMLSKKHRVLKITSTKTFPVDNLEKLSTIMVDVTQNQSVLDNMFPEFQGRELHTWACPDLLTPLQDPVVDRAPYNKGLHIATGGSYHSYKFLPIIGEMVVDHLQGKSDTLRDDRWKLERSLTKSAIHPSVVPEGCSVTA